MNSLIPQYSTVTEDEKLRTLSLAGHLIYLSNQEPVGENRGINLMQLIGLLFYAQAFSLLHEYRMHGSIKDRQDSPAVLLSESFYASKYGPRLQSLFQAYAGKYGNDPIPPYIDNIQPLLSQHDRQQLTEIWGLYKGISGEMLFSGMTQPETPWDRIRKSYKAEISDNRFVTIPLADIEDYIVETTRKEHPEFAI